MVAALHDRDEQGDDAVGDSEGQQGGQNSGTLHYALRTFLRQQHRCQIASNLRDVAAGTDGGVNSGTSHTPAAKHIA